MEQKTNQGFLGFADELSNGKIDFQELTSILTAACVNDKMSLIIRSKINNIAQGMAKLCGHEMSYLDMRFQLSGYILQGEIIMYPPDNVKCKIHARLLCRLSESRQIELIEQTSLVWLEDNTPEFPLPE